MNGWQLGLDFGTSYTVAAIATAGKVAVIDIESNGRSRMPSSVFLNHDDRFLVGEAARHQATFSPERFEPTPKRVIGEGELFLGDRLVTVTEMISAVLRRAYTEACLHQGETAPTAVRLTHPATWSGVRLGALREAAELAGIEHFTFLEEPVAAAGRIGLLSTSPGDVVAVYDLGGGTFDAAVLRRTEDGFEIAGNPVGRDPLGGEDLDRKIIDHLAKVLSDGNTETWQNLLSPTDAGWRRKANDLRAEVQRAKETLSDSTVCQLWIPGLERDAQLSRVELNELIGADIESTVDTLDLALAGASVTASDLAGVYLVGGSSRIPLVADSIWSRLGVRPSVQENPKSLVALGAAGWDLLTSAATTTVRNSATRILTSEPESEAARRQTGPVAVGSGADRPSGEASADEIAGAYRSRLAMAVGIDTWSQGCACVAELELDRPAGEPMTIRVRDEPVAPGVDSRRRSDDIGALRRRRTVQYVEKAVEGVTFLGAPAVERKFSMYTANRTVEMFERYLAGNGRGIVLASPEESRPVAESLAYLPLSLPPQSFFEARFAIALPDGWTATERVTMKRRGTNQMTVAERTSSPGIIGAAEWRTKMEAAAMRLGKNAVIVARGQGPVLNRFQGEIFTVTWMSGDTAMVSKVGLSLEGGFGYAVTVSMPRSEQSQAASLARQARFSPTGG